MPSSYWYSLAMQEVENYNRLNDKLLQYTNYTNNLYNLSIKLNSSVSSMQSAESNYKNGGYISQGQPLDNGALSSYYGVLNKDIAVINSVIGKLAVDMQEIEQAIQKSMKDYQTYAENYNAALAKEQAAGQ